MYLEMLEASCGYPEVLEVSTVCLKVKEISNGICRYLRRISRCRKHSVGTCRS